MGHIHLFKAAKQEGDVLIVAVNDDSSIRKIKGPERPVFVLAERLEVLEAVDAVDYLVAFSEETPIKPISALLPDVLVKGGDWKPEEVVGGTEVKAAGGKIVIVPYLPGYSSTGIIERILKT
jgi:D-beta-D-heptose 7-phosphate kinase/D-beta-D-heptose 1-phosphate adenosyltransferase